MTVEKSLPSPFDPRMARLQGLYVAHASAIRRSLRRRTPDRDLVEDVLQETFIRALASLEGIDERSALRWLISVASNLLVDEMRTVARSGRLGPRVIEADQADGDPEGAVLRDEAAGLVRSALAQIKPWHRRILMLREVESLAYGRIAEIEGVTEDSVRSGLARARRSFRQALRAQIRRGLRVILPFPFLRAVRRLQARAPGMESGLLQVAGNLTALAVMTLAALSAGHDAQGKPMGSPAVRIETVAQSQTALPRPSAQRIDSAVGTVRTAASPAEGAETKTRGWRVGQDFGEVEIEQGGRVHQRDDQILIERRGDYRVGDLVRWQPHSRTSVDCGNGRGTAECRQIMPLVPRLDE